MSAAEHSPPKAPRLPVALDAMGTDRGPAEVVAAARQARDDHGIDVILVGRPDALGDTDGIEVLAASDIIDMGDDPATAVRRKRDASVVRCAEAVRDGHASAMVSAGNTGAAMASALLRMGRIRGVGRPAIATVLPVPGFRPTVLLDSGANAECTPAWLVQFAQMGGVFFAERFGAVEPRVALLSTKGTPLVKETHALLSEPGCLSVGTFIGNVEGRDVLSDVVDVVVTDGFTGNVVLKTLEGGVGFVVRTFLAAMGSTEEARRATDALLPVLAPIYTELDPDTYGGAMLLGVKGVCIISHGSSSARALVNAVRVGREMADAGLVDHLRAAVGSVETAPSVP